MSSPDSIDRVTPTIEPEAQVVMHQNWHHLLFLHWEVPPAELQALIPPPLDLDTFDGKAYVGLVPFTLSGVRPILAPPLPWISSFHEINVRTYVHLKGRDPGVWFFSLDASSLVAVEAARAFYHLPYFHSQIDMKVGDHANPSIDFVSHRADERGAMPAQAHIQYAPVEGPVRRAAVSTLDFFLCERYVLYATDSRHHLFRARVHHPPYPLQRAETGTIEETMIWAAGIKRSEEAPIRHYAKEVNVKIYLPEKV